ncbi:hypothetical protein BJP36_40290 [Moorena producens JHB]|uniref:Tc1-like transposase DDE domain-containing protein n=1 Tax=Moorena producens (strain JHB) TaxID=1454205 RepID=A0A9Q9UVA3_MOOP1|nr:hypothetical protein [Moorena producens]WAN68614.1 hypothetical protein BJP36_40290 [Moorena producens JHB]
MASKSKAMQLRNRGGSAVLGVPPTRGLPWFPPLAIASRQVKIPEGIIVKFLPPYSPELQPAERLWSLIDEPLVNESFKTINEIEERLVTRCQLLLLGRRSANKP